MKRGPTIIVRDENLRQRAIALLTGLDLSKPWQVTIEPYRKRRSLSQNALMWAWVDEVTEYVREHTGHERDEVHDFLKAKFLPKRFVEINGELREVPPTTTELTTQEMATYMDSIYAWATTGLGLKLPLPVRLGERAA